MLDLRESLHESRDPARLSETRMRRVLGVMMPEAVVGLPREGLRAVDHTDFDDFYRSVYPQLHRIALARCGSHALAEELVQETMVKVFARWSRVSAYDNPVAYCCRIVVNE